MPAVCSGVCNRLISAAAAALMPDLDIAAVNSVKRTWAISDDLAVETMLSWILAHLRLRRAAIRVRCAVDRAGRRSARCAQCRCGSVRVPAQHWECEHRVWSCGIPGSRARIPARKTQASRGSFFPDRRPVLHKRFHRRAEGASLCQWRAARSKSRHWAARSKNVCVYSWLARNCR